MPAYSLSIRKMALEALLSLNPPKAITEVYPFLSKTKEDDVVLRGIIEKYATSSKNKVVKA
ncbi:MAG: hypothetical protein QW035_03860 [Candidatus Anstonellales archaeon]